MLHVTILAIFLRIRSQSDDLTSWIPVLIILGILIWWAIDFTWRHPTPSFKVRLLEHILILVFVSQVLSFLELGATPSTRFAFLYPWGLINYGILRFFWGSLAPLQLYIHGHFFPVDHLFPGSFHVQFVACYRAASTPSFSILIFIPKSVLPVIMVYHPGLWWMQLRDRIDQAW